MRWKLCEQGEVLVEELQRLNSENKMLTETLKHVCESYVALQKHLSEFNRLKNANFEREETASLKRKVESENCSNLFCVNAHTECSSEEETFKKPKQSSTTPKVQKVFVRTDASDTSLVSSIFNKQIRCFQIHLLLLLSVTDFDEVLRTN